MKPGTLHLRMMTTRMIIKESFCPITRPTTSSYRRMSRRISKFDCYQSSTACQFVSKDVQCAKTSSKQTSHTPCGYPRRINRFWRKKAWAATIQHSRKIKLHNYFQREIHPLLTENRGHWGRHIAHKTERQMNIFHACQKLIICTLPFWVLCPLFFLFFFLKQTVLSWDLFYFFIFFNN